MDTRKEKPKKHDYKVISNKVCKICEKPLKQNIADKGHVLCYVCFKISKGKKYSTKSKKDEFENIINVKKIDFVKLQEQNIKKYKGGVK